MITSAPLAPLGIVRHLDHYTPSAFHPGCAILCRNTAPLVSFAFSLIKRSLGGQILGRDIAEGLLTLVKIHTPSAFVSGSISDPVISDLLTNLDAWTARECDKLYEKGWNQQAETLQEKSECIHIIASNVGLSSPIPRLSIAINDLFTPTRDKSLITLCTIHKSKGLEFLTVFLLDSPKYMPSKYATSPGAKQQEKNLFYVAITRAKNEFYYINTGTWKEQQQNAQA